MEKQKLFRFGILFLCCCFLAGFLFGYLKNTSVLKVSYIPRQPTLTPSTKTVDITPDAGGVVAITDESGTTTSLVVPKGAVQTPTKITVTALSEPPFETEDEEHTLPGVIIGPDTLTLLHPAILTFHFSQNINADTLFRPEEAVGVGLRTQTGNQGDMISPTATPRVVRQQRERRSGWPPHISFDIPTFVISTHGTSTSAGTSVVIFRSEQSEEDNTISTPVSSAGTYSPDTNVDHNEAVSNLETVLLDEHATLDMVFDAACIANDVGFIGLSVWAKNTLHEWAGTAVLALAGECTSTDIPVGKMTFIKWQQIAQNFGWGDLVVQFRDLLESCKKYYTFEFMDDRSGGNYSAIHRWRFTNCGLIDDPFTGTMTSQYGGIIWGSCQSSSPFTVTLPVGGGTSSFVDPPEIGNGPCGPDTSPCNNCPSFNVTRSIVYDGELMVSMPYANGALTSVISILPVCPSQTPGSGVPGNSTPEVMIDYGGR